MIHFAYSHSNIPFGIEIYNTTAKRNMERISSIQKRTHTKSYVERGRQRTFYIIGFYDC